MGFCDLGFAPVPEQPDLHYAVSIAVRLSDAVLKTISDKPSFTYFHHYRTANAKLDSVAFDISEKIMESGYNAFPVAASQSLGKNQPYNGVLPHKTAAVLSGLGFVGKSGLFLSAKYGSKIRLATVLTDMPLEAQSPVLENACGACTVCRDACPAGAIFGLPPQKDGTRNFDPEKCSKYMKEHFMDTGRGSVCGICIRVCPYNKLR